MSVHKVVYSPNGITRYCEYCGLDAPFDTQCKVNSDWHNTPSVLIQNQQTKRKTECQICFKSLCPSRAARPGCSLSFVSITIFLALWAIIVAYSYTFTPQLYTLQPNWNGSDLTLSSSYAGTAKLSLAGLDPQNQVKF